MARKRTGALRRAAGVRMVLMGLALALAGAPAHAQTDRPPDEELAGLQERGRQIALYLQAVDRAEALLKTQGGGVTPPERTVAVLDREGWRVLYLATPSGGPAAAGAPAKKGLAIVAETTFSPDSGQLGAFKPLVPSKIAPASILAYVRSLEEAEKATLSGPEPFLEAIVRESGGTFSVYVMPQRTEDGAMAPAAERRGAVVLGRDSLVRVGANGKQVVADKLHDSVVALPLQPRAPGAPLLHEHDKGDLPAPTDVALVVRYPVLAPLLVLTRRFIFRVDKEGAVTWLGPNPNPKPAASASPPPGTGGS